MTMRTLTWCLVCLLLVSFTHDDPEQFRTETATLYIYRGREFGSFSYGIILNGEKVGSLSTNRFIRLSVPAGKTVLQGRQSYLVRGKPAYFTADAGKTYFVKAIEDVDFMTRYLRFGFVSEEQAKRELARIKPMEPEKPETPSYPQGH